MNSIVEKVAKVIHFSACVGLNPMVVVEDLSFIHLNASLLLLSFDLRDKIQTVIWK